MERENGKSKTWARNQSAEYTLCRLSAEIAYVQKRLCIRKAKSGVASALMEAAKMIEKAIQLEMEEGVKS